MNTKTYEFDTEAEAQSFADQMKANGSPIDDVYVYGPTFMDGKRIFHNMTWAEGYNKTWWNVTVETYK
jgi:hypothetical protein